jgi:cyclophilin family peptidyl-prolyl cis-trans isomerase
MKPFQFILFSFALFVAPGNSEYEVPTKKAIPPKMDPIPYVNLLFFVCIISPNGSMLTSSRILFRTLPVVTHRAFFDIELDGQKLGRIIVGLFGDVAPKTVENFVALCNCDKGKGKLTGKDLCYKGTKIHRVIPNFMFQGGDFTHGDGTGGESIWGGPFEDESFQVKHNRRYMLNMANSGKRNSNRSQWYINTSKTTWLDGKDVVFGMVLEGKDAIAAIEQTGTHGGKPRSDIVMVDSGTLPITPEDATPRRVSDRLTS